MLAETFLDYSPVWLLYAGTVLQVDLERPRQQLFEVSQQPMADVARRIESFRP